MAVVSGNTSNEALRILEFYSGVGGMHYAAKACGVPCSVLGAFDINPLANSVYQHNFPDIPVSPRNIEGLSPEELDKFQADVFLMSPPCQPYTRQGLQAGSADPRSQSFLSLLDALPKLQHPPKYILIENVKGFDTSETRNETVRILESCSFTVQEYLLSPLQFGVPNSRLRYYLVACRCASGHHDDSDASARPASPPVHTVQSIVPSLAGVPASCALLRSASRSLAVPTSAEPTSVTCTSEDRPEAVSCDGQNPKTPSISTSWEESAVAEDINNTTGSTQQHESSPEPGAKRLCRSPARTDRSAVLVNSTSDAMSSSATKSCAEPSAAHQSWCRCGSRFTPENATAAVLKPVIDFLQDDLTEEVTGELLLPQATLDQYRKVLDVIQATCCHSCCFTKNYGRYLRGTGSVLNCADKVTSADGATEKLRYLSPREVANLMCFPADFNFPASLTTKQRYRCLGNSLNVLVVAWLLRYLFTSELR